MQALLYLLEAVRGWIMATTYQCKFFYSPIAGFVKLSLILQCNLYSIASNISNKLEKGINPPLIDWIIECIFGKLKVAFWCKGMSMRVISRECEWLVYMEFISYLIKCQPISARVILSLEVKDISIGCWLLLTISRMCNRYCQARMARHHYWRYTISRGILFICGTHMDYEEGHRRILGYL